MNPDRIAELRRMAESDIARHARHEFEADKPPCQCDRCQRDRALLALLPVYEKAVLHGHALRASWGLKESDEEFARISYALTLAGDELVDEVAAAEKALEGR